MAQSNKLVLDGAAWASNVLSSVFIIFVNKILMSKTGYRFQYGELLPDQALVGSAWTCSSEAERLSAALAHTSLIAALHGGLRPQWLRPCTWMSAVGCLAGTG